MGDNDNETLSNVTSASWDFEDEAFDEISDNAKDFITKLLKKDMKYTTVQTQKTHILEREIWWPVIWTIWRSELFMYVLSNLSVVKCLLK